MQGIEDQQFQACLNSEGCDVNIADLVDRGITLGDAWEWCGQNSSQCQQGQEATNFPQGSQYAIPMNDRETPILNERAEQNACVDANGNSVSGCIPSGTCANGLTLECYTQSAKELYYEDEISSSFLLRLAIPTLTPEQSYALADYIDTEFNGALDEATIARAYQQCTVGGACDGSLYFDANLARLSPQGQESMRQCSEQQWGGQKTGAVFNYCYQSCTAEADCSGSEYGTTPETDPAVTGLPPSYGIEDGMLDIEESFPGQYDSLPISGIQQTTCITSGGATAQIDSSRASADRCFSSGGRVCVSTPGQSVPANCGSSMEALTAPYLGTTAPGTSGTTTAPPASTGSTGGSVPSGANVPGLTPDQEARVAEALENLYITVSVTASSGNFSDQLLNQYQESICIDLSICRGPALEGALRFFAEALNRNSNLTRPPSTPGNFFYCTGAKNDPAGLTRKEFSISSIRDCIANGGQVCSAGFKDPSECSADPKTILGINIDTEAVSPPAETPGVDSPKIDLPEGSTLTCNKTGQQITTQAQYGDCLAQTGAGVADTFVLDQANGDRSTLSEQDLLRTLADIANPNVANALPTQDDIIESILADGLAYAINVTATQDIPDAQFQAKVFEEFNKRLTDLCALLPQSCALPRASDYFSQNCTENVCRQPADNPPPAKPVINLVECESLDGAQSRELDGPSTFNAYTREQMRDLVEKCVEGSMMLYGGGVFSSNFEEGRICINVSTKAGRICGTDPAEIMNALEQNGFFGTGGVHGLTGLAFKDMAGGASPDVEISHPNDPQLLSEGNVSDFAADQGEYILWQYYQGTFGTPGNPFDFAQPGVCQTGYSSVGNTSMSYQSGNSEAFDCIARGGWATDITGFATNNAETWANHMEEIRSARTYTNYQGGDAPPSSSNFKPRQTYVRYGQRSRFYTPPNAD